MSLTVMFKDKDGEVVGQECDTTEEGEHGLKLRNKGDSDSVFNQVGYIPYERLLYVRPTED